MKNTKKLYGIIALFVVIIGSFSLSGCVTVSKTLEPKIFDSSIPEEQTATFLIPRPKDIKNQRIMLRHFYYENLGDSDFKIFQKQTNVGVPNPILFIIPAGPGYCGVEIYATHTDYSDTAIITFRAVAGRNYQLVTYPPVGTTYAAAYAVYEVSQTREPKSNEQELYIKYDNTWNDSLLVFVLNKGTNDERFFHLANSKSNEIRIIVPKGEHTIDIDCHPIIASSKGAVKPEPDGNQPRRFSASSEPVRYSITMDIKLFNRPPALKYTLTQQ